jgi:Lrp/AsnC family leucine-responsive transcriptional regulator
LPAGSETGDHNGKSFVAFVSPMNINSPDDTDRRFLALLQDNNRRPLRDYAQELGISAATCLRRLRRLQGRRIIVRHAAIIDLAKLGLAVTAFVEVSLTEASGPKMAAFERRMERCIDVLSCAELVGSVDYMLTVAVTDMLGFGRFARKHLTADPNVKTYRSLLVLKSVKDSHQPGASARS